MLQVKLNCPVSTNRYAPLPDPPNLPILPPLNCKESSYKIFSYSATKRNDGVLYTIAPSPAGFEVFMHLPQNQFSCIDVTTSATKTSWEIPIKMVKHLMPFKSDYVILSNENQMTICNKRL